MNAPWIANSMAGAGLDREVAFPPRKLRTRETFGKMAMAGNYLRFWVATSGL